MKKFYKRVTFASNGSMAFKEEIIEYKIYRMSYKLINTIRFDQYS